VVYWSEEGCERTELLGLFIAHLMEHRWGMVIDAGWSDWDVVIHSHPWTVLRVLTTQEDHGGRKHLIRVRYQMVPSGLLMVSALTGAFALAVGALLEGWGAVILLVPLLLACLGMWWRGTQRAAQAAAALDFLARSLNLLRCSPAPAPAETAPKDQPEAAYPPAALLGGSLEEAIET
jgi:hypothetical protein